MVELRIVLTTVPQAAAETIVRTLVEERLAACGNLVAATSIYRWQGELCRDPETVVLMETTVDRVAALVSRLEVLHPYECPKIVVLAPEQVNAAYVAWAQASTRGH